MSKVLDQDMYFQYGEIETEYLKSKDARLARVIEQIGKINRKVDSDLFGSVVHQIVGQQISTKAQETVWQRIVSEFGYPTPEAMSKVAIEDLQSCGTTFRKCEYIKDFAHKVLVGDFDIEAVKQMSDADAIKALSSLKGIGTWTAEMILLFCLQRPNIFAYDDLAIQRGLRIVYHHRKITRQLFEKYRKIFSPYCSVASLYLWAVAGGALDVK